MDLRWWGLVWNFLSLLTLSFDSHELCKLQTGAVEKFRGAQVDPGPDPEAEGLYVAEVLGLDSFRRNQNILLALVSRVKLNF